MKKSRRTFLSSAALLAGAVAASAHAQTGQRPQRGSGSQPPTRSGDADLRGSGAPRPLTDPLGAVERELPSLRIDLKLTAEQSPLFDSFERQVRNAAEAARVLARHVSAFRVGDASTLSADTVLGTIVDDDTQRAAEVRLALERMTALYAALTPEQRRQFDRRIIQALREPLGNS
jgi:hypothetical protein